MLRNSRDFLVHEKLPFSCAFKIPIFGLTFDSLILICLIGDFFEFLFFGVLWTSWIWESISFLRFGKLSAIISLNKFSGHFFFYTYIGLLVGVWKFLRFFFFNFFFPYAFVFLFLIFMVVPHSMWDISSPTRDQTYAPCIGSAVLTTGLPEKSHCFCN